MAGDRIIVRETGSLKLSELRAQVRNAAGVFSGETLAKLIAAEALTQTRLGFREARDPYGRPWAPLKFRQGTPLRDTGRMANAFTTIVSGPVVTIGVNVQAKNGKSIVAVHQYGATILPVNAKALRFRGAERARGKKTTYGSWIFAKKVTIPARPMIPDTARGLPTSWERAFDAVAARYTKSLFRRG